MLIFYLTYCTKCTKPLTNVWYINHLKNSVHCGIMNTAIRGKIANQNNQFNQERTGVSNGIYSKFQDRLCHIVKSGD